LWWFDFIGINQRQSHLGYFLMGVAWYGHFLVQAMESKFMMGLGQY